MEAVIAVNSVALDYLCSFVIVVIILSKNGLLPLSTFVDLDLNKVTIVSVSVQSEISSNS